VRSLGAAEIIDHTRQDLANSGETYDVIFDAVGKTSCRYCPSSLTPDGLYLVTEPRRQVALSRYTPKRASPLGRPQRLHGTSRERVRGRAAYARFH
jgi:hypothetical protein